MPGAWMGQEQMRGKPMAVIYPSDVIDGFRMAMQIAHTKRHPWPCGYEFWSPPFNAWVIRYALAVPQPVLRGVILVWHAGLHRYGDAPTPLTTTTASEGGRP